MTTDTDCDDDGLSNEVEINKLGTDPYAVDSDNDYISDKVEVQGFTFGGKQWYLDPLNPDSNGDGLAASQVATVTITVNPINEAPTVVEQALVIQEDTPLTITLRASDPDGDALA